MTAFWELAAKLLQLLAGRCLLMVSQHQQNIDSNGQVLDEHMLSTAAASPVSSLMLWHCNSQDISSVCCVLTLRLCAGSRVRDATAAAAVEHIWHICSDAPVAA